MSTGPNLDDSGGPQIVDSGIELCAVPLLLLLFRTELVSSGPTVGRGEKQIVAALPQIREAEVSLIVGCGVPKSHKLPLPIRRLPLLGSYRDTLERLAVLVLNFPIDDCFRHQLQNYWFVSSRLNRWPHRYRKLPVIEESRLPGNRRVGSWRKVGKGKCAIGGSKLGLSLWRVNLHESVGNWLSCNTVDDSSTKFDGF